MPVAEVARQMLDYYPRELNVDRGLFVRCIEACYDCADICAATGRVVSRQTGVDADVTGALVQACIAACRSCGDECELHAAHGMEHCRVCAEECRRCVQACQELLPAIGGQAA